MKMIDFKNVALFLIFKTLGLRLINYVFYILLNICRRLVKTLLTFLRTLQLFVLWFFFFLVFLRAYKGEACFKSRGKIIMSKSVCNGRIRS